MYVCICNALCDRSIRQVLDSGVRQVSEVHGALGCETQCGRCLPTIADMMDEHVNGAPLAAE